MQMGIYIKFRIIVLANGNVIEVGSPSDLLANKDSQFFSLAAESGLVASE